MAVVLLLLHPFFLVRCKGQLCHSAEQTFRPLLRLQLAVLHSSRRRRRHRCSQTACVPELRRAGRQPAAADLWAPLLGACRALCAPHLIARPLSAD